MTKSAWKNPVCNFCQSKEYRVLYPALTYWEYEGTFRIVQCNNCSLVFLSPRPPLREIARYYEVDNYFGRDIQNIALKINDSRERNNTFGPVYSLIQSKINKGTILDIGAGTGLFLSHFKSKGWKVDGVELTTDAVSYAEQHYKIKLKKGDFFDFHFKKNTLDVVTLNGALEHLYDPLETLTEIFSILKKGGLVVISVPNVESMGRVLFGKDWFPWQPPRHLYHFSPSTLSKMLQRAGFNNIAIHHNYHLQNKYILFNSLRYQKSPKFQKKPIGGLLKKDNISSPTITVRLGKHIWNFISETLARFEAVINRGEVLLVVAEKK